MQLNRLVSAHYAGIVSVLALGVSVLSYCTAQQAFNLGVTQYEQQLEDKKPAVDVQLRSIGVSTQSITVSISNRGVVNITPLDFTALHSFEAGSLYLGYDSKGIDKLSATISLSSLGTIPPGQTRTVKAILAGVTDGKYEQFTPDLELMFLARVRMADQNDTIENILVTRRILPPTQNLQPDVTPQHMLEVLVRAKENERRNRMIFAISASLSMLLWIAFVFLWWRDRRSGTSSHPDATDSR
ncbi:hypothetical protein [Afipia felis]|uniref:Uncharacterized protein n=2 Tax=Afipia felis TaxID=1035 RepID=A0A380W7Z2_AFIFE|nr:hypothetical protein [Afipia felis]EKS28246.1 hypothetical protein HMPREF9697_00774 [Afipia felis ATCC 53690]SUU76955.1 Uncharacterised protein [Afipia felis]SUU85022.1 Uncharacterised protein [Afipia felis]